MAAVSHPQINWRASGTTSDPVMLNGNNLCGFIMPASFVGTSITFNMSDKIDGTFVPVYDDTGTALTYTVSTSRYVRVKPSDFAGIRVLQLVSSSSEAANTVVKLAVREIA